MRRNSAATFAADALLGTEGPDALAARRNGDVVHGLGGDDSLTSRFNRTMLFGGTGNDVLKTELTLFATGEDRTPDVTATQGGGDGDDRLTIVLRADSDGGGGGTGGIAARADGGAGNDQINVTSTLGLYGAPIVNLILGGAGDDQISATAAQPEYGLSSNRIDAGSGHDNVTAFAKGNTDYGGDFGARNEIWGRAGDDVLSARAEGGDETRAFAQNDLYGGAGDDKLDAFAISGTNYGVGTTTNTLRGGAGDDILTARLEDTGYNAGARQTNLLYGGSGDDTMRADIGIYTLYGGDTLGATSANRMWGGPGDDTIFASAVADSESYSRAENALYGGAGDDRIVAVAEALYDDETALPPSFAVARNTVDGGAGNDWLVAETIAEDGRSYLYGGDGDDRLTAIGGSGNVLQGGRGENVVRGDADVDVFVFDFAELNGTDSRTRITDFDPSRDVLAFAGIADAGAPGLVDDLDAVGRVADSERGSVNAGFPTPGSFTAWTIEFHGLDVEDATSFADLVDDPATQLTLADEGLFA